MFSSHLHFIPSVDNTVFILIVPFSSSAVGLEGVIVDATRFLFHLHKGIPLYFGDFKFLKQSGDPEQTRCSYDRGGFGACSGKWVKAGHHLLHKKFNIGTICDVAFPIYQLQVPRKDQCWLGP